MRTRGLSPARAQKLSVNASAATSTPPPASPSLLDTLLKQFKQFTTNLAIDLVRDKAGILGLAERFPSKVRGTFIGLFESYVEQVSACGCAGRAARAADAARPPPPAR